MKKHLLFLPLLFWCILLNAQNNDTVQVQKNADGQFIVLEHKELKVVHKDGENQFLILGNAAVTFQASKNDIIQFTELNFKPIFLWKISKRLFIEAEVEIETGGGSPDIGLEYANMVYILNPYVTIHAGRFLPKFGAFRGRFGEDFLNRFARNPVGFGDGGIGAMNETGVGIQGGFQAGTSKITYDLYVSNGPHLLYNPASDNGNQGQFDYEAYIGNADHKAVGGRFGILPFSNSCLEVAYSFQYSGRTGDKQAMLFDNTGAGIDYNKVGMQMHGVDINFFHTLPRIKSTIRLTGEWKFQKVDNVDYLNADSTRFTFDNQAHAYYITASLRPAQLTDKVLRNLELAARFSQYFRPAGAPWGGSNLTKVEVGLDYWLKWNCLAKFTYEYVNGDASLVSPHAFYAQLVYGF